MVPGDNPILKAEDDVLGRSKAAKAFAGQVLYFDTSKGLVVGVLGAWGSGKTSFINLARADFDDEGITVLDFNPWMFSGADQLVESFFVELAAQLRISPGLAEVGRYLEEYGETFSGMAWLPLVGPWIERSRDVTKFLGKLLQRRKEGIGGGRAKLEEILAGLDKPIVVVLDDIDRLTTSEIRDVFKLVRLTASFPNIVYILAFDRIRVEEALAEQGLSGRDYLEKILQVTFDLPVAANQALNRQISTEVDRALTDIDNPGTFDEQLWPDVFMEIIRPLIRNMRDIRRYAASIHGTVRTLGGQISLTDVLALEAVRVFLPDVFIRLRSSVDGLTTTFSFSSGVRTDPPQLKIQIDGLIDAAGMHTEVVRAMIERLFPAGQRHIDGHKNYGSDWKRLWLREHRVAHEDILRLYLEGFAGEGLQAFTDAEQAWVYMANHDALDSYLRSLDPERLQDVIASLENYEDQFVSQHVVPGTLVLLNLISDLPARPRGMFDLDTRLVVTRITYRLLRTPGDPQIVESAVREVFPKLKSLSAKLELITQVGYREGAGHKLVSEDAAAGFEKIWRDEVRSTSAEILAKERDLLRILYLTKQGASSSEDSLHIGASPELTLAVLRSAQSEVRSQAVNSRTIHRSQHLDWDVLIELYGDEVTLKERIEALKATTESESVDELLGLADRYLGGWRPKDFGDD